MPEESGQCRAIAQRHSFHDISSVVGAIHLIPVTTAYVYPQWSRGLFCVLRTCLARNFKGSTREREFYSNLFGGVSYIIPRICRVGT
jgi:hypothetical protein